MKRSNELKEILKIEFSLYFSHMSEFRKAKLLRNETFYIWSYVKLLRRCEYYKNHNKRLLYFFNERRRNKLGLKLGFAIPLNVFGKGLKIYHMGSIIVNPRAKVGENCVLHVMNCIGNKGDGYDGAPKVGNNVKIGMGAIIIGDIMIADDCVIGANSVVLRSYNNKGKVLVGSPAIEKR